MLIWGPDTPPIYTVTVTLVTFPAAERNRPSFKQDGGGASTVVNARS